MSCVLTALAAFMWLGAVQGAEVAIISPHWEGIRKEYEWAFREWHEEQFGEPVDVQWLDQGGTSDDVKFIRSEFSGGKDSIGIDVFWGGGTDPYVAFAEEGLLQPYRVADELLAAIPKDIFGSPVYDANFRWYGSALSGFGIIVNRRVLKRMSLPMPERWEDLGRPEFASWVGTADPRSSGSVHMMYEIILQAYGFEKGFEIIHRLGANVRSFPNSSSQTPKDVALGEVAIGLAIDQYALAQKAASGSDDLEYIMPVGQTVINPDGISILKGAPNLKTAQRLVDFVLSKEGQTVLMLPPGAPGGPRRYGLGRMSVRPDVFDELGERSLVKTNPFILPSSLAYDSKRGSARWALVNDLIGALIIDCHDDLRLAWEAVRRAGMPDDALATLVSLPVTEEEAFDLAKNTWGQADAKNVEIDRWIKFAKSKYARVLAQTAGPSRLTWIGHAVRYAIPLALAVFVMTLFAFDLMRRFASLRRAWRRM